jgi:phage shock protein A
MHEITDKYNIDGAMSTFDNAASQIQEQSDRLAAYDKIAVSEGEELDKQLEQLTGKVKVDAALDDLKRKMGLIKEAPASQQQQQPESQKISSAFDTEKES